MPLPVNYEQFGRAAPGRVSSYEALAIVLHRNHSIRVPVHDKYRDLSLGERTRMCYGAKVDQLLLEIRQGCIPISCSGLAEQRGTSGRPARHIEYRVDSGNAPDIPGVFHRPVKAHQSASTLGQKTRLVGEMKSGGDGFVELRVYGAPRGCSIRLPHIHTCNPDSPCQKPREEPVTAGIWQLLIGGEVAKQSGRVPNPRPIGFCGVFGWFEEEPRSSGDVDVYSRSS